MAKLTNEMANKLSLDTTSATKTLKEFTGEVKKSNNEWKVQEAQLKSAGDAIGASKARYEGLTNVVEKQTAKVDSLKLALENTNTSTDKGKKLQEKLTDELAKAERQLNSYNGQLDKASDAYKYQSSGIAKLNEDVQHNTTLTNANVRALQAEGKENEANKVKLQGLTSTRDKLNSILKKQEEELSKLSETGEKNSSAYKKQEIRVAEMKAKLAEANQEIKSMNGRGIKLNTSSLDRTREKLNSMNEAINRSNHMFAKMLGANLAVAGITSALSSVKGHITGVISAGADYNRTMQNIEVGFDTFTNGNKELAGQLTDTVKKIRDTSGYTETVGAAMTKMAYGITKNKEETEKLTNSLGNLGRAYGKSDDGMSEAIKTMSQMQSTGKITSGSISKMDKQFKGFGDQLAKTMGVSRDQLNDFASKGKVSMNDVKNAMNDLSKTKPLALDNYYKTFDGFTNHFKARYQSLSGEITKGFFSNSNAMLASLSKSLDGKDVDDAFKRFGNSVNKAANTIFGAFSKSFGKKGENPVVTFANAASTGVEKLANFIASHSKDIQNFFKGMAGAAKIVGASMKIGLKMAIPVLSSLGSLATKHNTTFKILAGSIVGVVAAIKGLMFVSKVVTAWTMMSKVLKTAQITTKAMTAAQWAMNAALNANPIGIIVVAIAALVLGFVELYKHNKKFKKFVDGIVKAAKKLFDGVIKWFKKLPENVKKLFNNVINFFKKDWKQIALFIVNPIGGAIALLYKHFKPFRDFINGIGKFFKNVFKSMGDVVSDVFDGIKTAINFVIKVISKIMKTELDIISKVWNTIWGGISSFFGGIWNGISGFIGGVMKGIHSTISGVLNNISSVWKSVWSGISSFFGNVWDGIKSMASSSVNFIIDAINGITKGINGVTKHIPGIGSKMHIDQIDHVKFSHGGIVTHEDKLSMVNDGDGSDWRELIKLPNGKLGYAPQRNAVLKLPAGTRIYSGEETKKMTTGAFETKTLINNFAPDKIVPVEGVKASNGYQLLNKSSESRQTAQNGKSLRNSSSDAKLDQIILLLTMMLGVNRDQLAKMLSTGGSMNGMYNQMARDNTIRNYQSI